MKARKAATTLERKQRETSQPALVKKVMRLTEDLRDSRRAHRETAETLGRWETFEQLLGLAESLPDVDITWEPTDFGRAEISDGKERLVFNRDDSIEDVDRDHVLMDEVLKWLGKKESEAGRLDKKRSMPVKLERDTARAMMRGGRTDVRRPGEAQRSGRRPVDAVGESAKV